jgi:repressor LexA
MFSLKLKKLREDAGFSQYTFAEKFGVAQSTVGNWESRKREPNFETMQKLADFFGVSVDYLLGRENEGAGERPEPTMPGCKWIPVLGSVVAGMPVEAIQEILDWEELDAKTAAQGEHFALKIKGDSMEPVLFAGDVIIVQQQPTAENNDVVVALVNGDEATVKRIKIRPEGLMLIPNNPAYEPMFYSNHEIESLPVTVLGVAVEVRRSLRSK